MNNLKSLLPSVILILIYFVAEEFFGPLAGICTALLLGTTEFLYTRFREKRYDKVILWTTLFFCIPGLIMLWAGEHTLMARLQPAFIESLLCVLLGLFAFSRTGLLAALPAGYRKNISLSASQQQQMRQRIKILFILLCSHTLISYLMLIWMPGPTADFISTPFMYILTGGYFAFLFLRNRLLLRKIKHEEWLPIINESGEITGKAPRTICHAGTKLLHPVVHLHIINQQKDFFLQKRSMKKDLLPGLWDTAVGGHIGINETVEEALKREAFEELGLTDFEARFLGHYIWESPREREFVFSFLCTRYRHMHIDNDEVDEGRFWSAAEIEKGIREKQLTPNFAHEYTTLLKKIRG